MTTTLNTEDRLPPAGYLRLRDIVGDRKTGTLGIIPVSKAGWSEGVRCGRYPPSFRLGAGVRVVGWRVQDIRTLLNDIERGISRDWRAVGADSHKAGA